MPTRRDALREWKAIVCLERDPSSAKRNRSLERDPSRAKRDRSPGLRRVERSETASAMFLSVDVPARREERGRSSVALDDRFTTMQAWGLRSALH
jgi:hypothetical protein